MQQREIHPNDEELVVALSNRGLPLSTGRTLLLTEKKSVLLRNTFINTGKSSEKRLYCGSFFGLLDHKQKTVHFGGFG